jgi:hypothetical protein
MAAIALLFVPQLPPLFAVPAPATAIVNLPTPIVMALSGLTYAYVGLLLVVKIVQYVNLFLDRSLPPRWQNVLNRYAGLIPIIIWRVFSVDITNFFVRVFQVTPSGERQLVGEDTAYSSSRWSNLWFKIRYLHVGESVAIAALFNVQKHFASQPKLFEDRIRRYARSIGGGTLRFEYVLIRKRDGAFVYEPIVSYFVDTETGAISETKLVADRSPASTAQYSPIREAVGFGSYVKRA